MYLDQVREKQILQVSLLSVFTNLIGRNAIDTGSDLLNRACIILLAEI